MSTTPIRTAEKDKNYLSLNSQSIVWFAGTDQEREDPGPLARPLILTPDNPKDWDSILKCSGRQQTILSGVVVSQAKENVLDINNRSAGLSFDGEWGITGKEGEQVFTIKGASHDIKLGGPVHSRGTKADIVIGCWSDQSNDPAYNIDLTDLYYVSGRPLTVVVGRVASPILALFGKSKSLKMPKNSKVLFWASVGEILHWWGKRAAVKAGLFGS